MPICAIKFILIKKLIIIFSDDVDSLILISGLRQGLHHYALYEHQGTSKPIKSKADTNCSSFTRRYDGKRSPAVINQIAKLDERYPLQSVRHPVVEIGTFRNTTCWRTDFMYDQSQFMEETRYVSL